MAEQPSAPEATAADAAPLPQLALEIQYIKDLSFENPVGLELGTYVQQNPAVNIEVNTSARQISPNRYEVALFIRGEARAAEKSLFIIELTYAGVSALTNVPEEAVRSVLLIEVPRLLFPFARNIVAETTRDGGFPPLFIQPIDFATLYRQQHMAESS